MKVDQNKCLRCGGCVSVCPKNANELTEEGLTIDSALCVKCGLCIRACPVLAIDYD